MIQHKVRKKKRPVLMLIFKYGQSKITGLSKMWPLKSLATMKCKSRTSLHAAPYKWQSGSVLFCSYYFKSG